ncbi:alpha/beta hydrolase [Oryzibacter oryziterrae]|uniref:alpha/beta hydrolase n=1 Tax=Oryzibacter oryziterrae TaxID=2766474 RepID=UPI001F3F9366|nr:alpha/beta hydrolase [Oryzibacter oryziterrae]
MPLHPDIATLLAEADAPGLTPLEQMTIAEARRLDAEDPPAPGVPLDAVVDLGNGPVPLRLYRPFGAPTPAPAIVFIHGGGFALCTLSSYDGLCSRLAADSGAVVVSVDYRLAPEHPFPAAPDDCRQALRWIAAQASALGCDPARLMVAGDSAGGNLAAVAALDARDGGGPDLLGQVLVYPVTAHYSAGLASYGECATGYGLTAAGMKWMWDHYVSDPALHRHPRLSPLFAPELAGLPPTFLAAVEYDILRDEAVAYAERLKAAGNAVWHRLYPGVHHGCLSLLGQSDAADPLWRDMIAWIRARFAAA